MALLAVLSDSHDDLTALRRAARIMERRGITTAIHCGDITSPATVSELAPFTVHWVFGNCDVDLGGLRAAMERHGHVCHGLQGTLQVEGCSLAFTHGHRGEVLRGLVAGGAHAAVFHGHTHHRSLSRSAGTLVLCPGALAHARPAGFAILDLPALQVEWADL